MTVFNETFLLDCYKGNQVPETAGREARKYGAKAAKRDISNEYVAIRHNGGCKLGKIFSTLRTVGQNCYWHSVNDFLNYKLVMF